MFDIFLVDRQLNISEKHLTPWLSFGGPCLPKDVSALSSPISGLGLSAPIIENLLASNRAHTEYLLRRVKAHFSGLLEGEAELWRSRGAQG